MMSVCVGTFVYVIFSVIFGVNGIWAENQLKEQKTLLAIKVAELEKQNENLALRYEELLLDDSVIASYARKIGYVLDNEKLVKISGLSFTPDSAIKVLQPYFKSNIKYLDEWICKSFGLFVFFVLQFLFTLKRMIKNSKTNNFRVVHENV
jgi:cell division protein FtsB